MNFGNLMDRFRFGRWLSADWSAVPTPVAYANLTNPQTLNLYSMVADDPESFADLDGHDGPTLQAVVEVTMEEVNKVAGPLIESGRVARTINPKTKLGAPPSVLEGGAFDLAFFLLVSHP
jgi:hypothetical protein